MDEKRSTGCSKEYGGWVGVLRVMGGWDVVMKFTASLFVSAYHSPTQHAFISKLREY